MFSERLSEDSGARVTGVDRLLVVLLGGEVAGREQQGTGQSPRGRPVSGPLCSAARVHPERFGITQAMPTSAATKRLIGDRYDADCNREAITPAEAQETDFDGANMLKSLQTPTGVRLYVYDSSDDRVMRWDCLLDLCGPDTSQEHITVRDL